MTVNMVQIAFMFFDYDSRAKRYSLVTLFEEYSMKSAPLDQDDPNGLLQRCLNDYKQNDYTTEKLQNKNKKRRKTMMKQNNFHKRSLGHLRPAPKTKPKSPDCLGIITITRETMEQILEQNDGDDDIVASLAGWRNTDTDGSYLTIEISPKIQRRSEQISPEELFDIFRKAKKEIKDDHTS